MSNSTIVEKPLKELSSKETIQTLGEQEFKQLKDSIIDFLYKFKDQHPYSNPEEGKTMDVFDRVMQFMQDTNLKPSEELIKFYAQSETTKILNEIPSFMDLKEKIEMKREVYDKLKERYSSKPPFVYFFNPKLDVQTYIRKNKYGLNVIEIGFKNKEDVRI